MGSDTRTGSIPVAGTAKGIHQLIYVRLAQLDRAFGYGPKGRGFESSNARAHFTLEELDTFSSSIFMHTDAERKYAAKAARVRRASSGRKWLSKVQ